MIEQTIFERVLFYTGFLWFILVIVLVLWWEHFEEQKLYRKLLNFIDRFEKLEKGAKKK